MEIFYFIVVYLFALIGYFGTGILIYVNFDTAEFNKLETAFNKMLRYIFYKCNKDKCQWDKDHKMLYHNGVEYYESSVWNESYEPFNTIFELICILIWPVWIAINLIINSFNDD